MPKDNSEELCTCYRCGKSHLAESQFFKCNNGMYAHFGHLPICKTCFEEQYNSYVGLYKSKKKAMQRMCMAYDLYYNDDIFSSCDAEQDAFVGKYVRKLNMAQYKGKTFDTSVSEGILLFEDELKNKKKSGTDKEEVEIDPKDIEKWGSGFEPADYAILNSHYRQLSASNPQGESNAEIFIIDLCYTKMQQMKAVREGRVDDYNKLTESYRKSFTQAGLKTVKDTNAIEDFTIGVNAETIEKYTPAEYYKNKQLFKDSDNVGDYILRFLLRPLRNLMTGSKERDSEFFVKDEEENDGFTDDE